MIRLNDTAFASIPADAHVLAAVSGGSDSMAMLDILAHARKNHNFHITAAYLNHGIRPKSEISKDLTAIRTLCKRHRIRLITGKADVPTLANRTKSSLETAARDARFAFLKATARKIRATAVATAHTRDDQAETLLMRLMRGTGPDGLAGILPLSTREGMRLVRPVLDCSKAELREHLERQRIAWNEDSTNTNLAHFRNQIRHTLLPMLERISSPGVPARIAQLASLMADDAEWLAGIVKKELADEKDGRLNLATLLGKPVALQRRLVRSWLGGISDDMTTVERVLSMSRSATTADSIHLRGGWVLRVGRGHLVLSPDGGRGTVRPTSIHKLGQGGSPRRLVIPGVTRLPQLGIQIALRLHKGFTRTQPQRPGSWPATGYLSAAACQKNVLTVRTWRAGDRISPLGMKGSKKVQDVFTDLKVPPSEREAIPLVFCGKELVWIPGYRVARGWEVEEGEAASIEIVMKLINDRRRARR